ncbi:unnamed protein product, partial [Rotaria sordida]
EEEGEGDHKKFGKKREKKRAATGKRDRDVIGGDVFPRYSTIGQLTNATVVAEPPPAFARYMLRKSVDRLNSEFRVIVEFRSRLEEIQHRRYAENLGYRRQSRDNILDA